MNMEFKLIPVKTKPLKRNRTGSIYDPIIFEFEDNKMRIAQVIELEKNPKYVRRRLAARINDLKLDHKIKVSIINNELFLEKI